MNLPRQILELADLVIAKVDFLQYDTRLKTSYLFDLVRVEMKFFKHNAIVKVLDM